MSLFFSFLFSSLPLCEREREVCCECYTSRFTFILFYAAAVRKVSCECVWRRKINFLYIHDKCHFQQDLCEKISATCRRFQDREIFDEFMERKKLNFFLTRGEIHPLTPAQRQKKINRMKICKVLSNLKFALRHSRYTQHMRLWSSYRFSNVSKEGVRCKRKAIKKSLRKSKQNFTLYYMRSREGAIYFVCQRKRKREKMDNEMFLFNLQ